MTRLEAIGNYAVSGNAAYHVLSQLRGIVLLTGRTVTFSNSPAYSGHFVNCALALSLARVDGMTFTNGATVTGARYNVDNNGVIFTNGAGASYLPGNAAGTSSNGLYV